MDKNKDLNQCQADSKVWLQSIAWIEMVGTLLIRNDGKRDFGLGVSAVLRRIKPVMKGMLLCAALG